VLLFVFVKNPCDTHLSIYNNRSKTLQSCALYGNFPCRRVSLFKSRLTKSLQMTPTSRRRVRGWMPSWNIWHPCAKIAHHASVSFFFGSGDQTGSKLFLLVQQQQQQQLWAQLQEETRCFLLRAWSARRARSPSARSHCHVAKAIYIGYLVISLQYFLMF